MKSYTIKLQKTVVQTVNANSTEKACALVLADSEDGFDGEWASAEPTVEVIHVGAEQ